MTTRVATATEHDRLVAALARKLEQDGFHVEADHIGHANGAPQAIGGHVPDIKATKYGALIVAEAETADTIGSEETRRQWSAFSSATGGYGQEFHVIVPQASLGTAKRQASAWGIRVDNWWWV